MKFRTDSEVELRWYGPQDPDLEVANAARVSFGKQKDSLDESDIKLINYLAKHKHNSPFYHPQFSFRIRTPEFNCRQIFRHQIGIEYTSAEAFRGMPWNEISTRYAVMEDEFYVPEQFRKQSASNKQASDGIIEGEIGLYVDELYKETITTAFCNYKTLIERGVAKEIARGLLPVSFYTEFIMTCSLYSLSHFIKLRTHEGAQQEVRDVANQISDLIIPLAPISLKALLRSYNES